MKCVKKTTTTTKTDKKSFEHIYRGNSHNKSIHQLMTMVSSEEEIRSVFDDLHKNLCCGCSLELPHLDEAILMSTHNIEAIVMSTYNIGFMKK